MVGTKRPEILAPAGEWEAFLAAVENGADAVYLGGKGFNARQYAGNFGEEELRQAVEYAHLRGVKVYVTVNILVDDGELPDLIPYVRFLYESGVDAVIVQDLGVGRLIQVLFPHLELHASTQMTVHNLEGARLVREMGFARVVLARELSLAEIKDIRAGTSDLGLETFVHGALCISYSGQCLLSSLIGGRSGNRGRCAQPCRLEYTLVNEKGEEISGSGVGRHLLSPRDLKAIDLLPALVEAGVSAFKIEGRMKRPEYVATVVSVYRRALDRVLEKGAVGFSVPPADERRLAQSFNRDFTTGHFLGNPGRDLMSYQRPNNRGLFLGRVVAYERSSARVTVRLEEPLAVGDGVEFWVSRGGRVGIEVKELFHAGRPVPEAEKGQVVSFLVEGEIRPGDRVFKTLDRKLVAEAEASYRSRRFLRLIPVTGKVEVRLGQPLRLWLSDGEGNTVLAESDFLAEVAQKHPLTRTVLEEKIGRLGNTPFKLENLVVELEEGLMVPLSEINEVRRRAVEQLGQKRLQRTRPSLDESTLRRETQRLLASSWAVRRALAQEKGVFPFSDGRNVFAPLNDQSPRVVGGGKAREGDRRLAKPVLAVHVATLEGVTAALTAGAGYIFYGGEFYRSRGHLPGLEETREALDKTHRAERLFALVTPRISRRDDLALIRRQLEELAPLGPDLVVVGNLGTLALVRELGLPFWANFSLNAFNTLTVDLLGDLGARGVTLSPELTLEQIRRLVERSALPLGSFVHGPLPVMVSEYCAVGSLLGERRTGRPCRQPCWGRGFGLKDRLGFVFPIEMDQSCRMHIFNPMELVMLDHLPALVESGLALFQVEARRMKPADLRRVVSLYQKNLTAILARGTAYQVPAEDMEKLRQLIAGPDITRGHYFRGVL